MFHTPCPLMTSQVLTTQAFLLEAKEKRNGKESFKGASSYKTSSQNFVLLLLPTIEIVLALKASQPPLSAFHKPTP